MLALLRTAFSDPLLSAAWYRLLRLWRPMAAWTLLLWFIAAVLLVPLSSAVVSWQLNRSERFVIGNEELIAWLLTPEGVGYLLFAGSVVMTNWVLRYAGLFQTITDDLEGRQPRLVSGALRLGTKLTTLLRFTIKTVSLALLGVAPVIGGVWLIYQALLGEHDINYFLSVKPPAWYQALLAAGTWLAVSGGVLIYLGARIALALPSWLDGHRGFFVALRRSWSLTRARARRLLRVLALAASGWLVTRITIDATFFTVAAWIAEWLSERSPFLWPSVAWTGAYLAGSVMLDATIDFLGFSYLSTALTMFYFEETPLHHVAPPPRPFPQAEVAMRRWLAPRRSISIAAVLVAGSAFAGHQLLKKLPEVRPVVITAHRGGPAPAPENTLAALERAIAAGADASEIDVMRTRDGVVVVAHDADLMRLARDPRRIADRRYAEFSGVLKLPDDGGAPTERRLATLADFLERARGRIRLTIELKYYGWDPFLAEAAIREIRSARMEQEVTLMSLNLEALRQAQRLAPDITRGYVSTLAVGNVNRLPVNFVAVNQRRATPQLIQQAHRHGIEVHVWTVNSVFAIADLMELGVDGIITDVPARAVRVRNDLQELSPVGRLLLRFRKLLLDENE